jgi:archaellum component FlaG (FlaF/FlaG flagellin family)
MGHALATVYEGGGYNFYYAALVDDMNSDAHTRLNDFNLYGFPTAFYDGGYLMTLGGDSNPTTYKNGIKNCAKRAVAPLNLSIDMTVDGNSLQIHVVVANMDNPQAPVTPSAPSGPSTGTVGISYQFTASTTDPQADQISYLFDFGDGTDSGWMGPIASGATATVTHAWSHKGTFNVKVMAKDASGHSSSWSSNHVIVISAPTITLDVKASKGTVAVSVTNPGSQNLSSLTWSIHVHGGLLGFLDKNWNGTIDSLPAGQTTTVNSGKIFGLGPIKCDVLVAGTAVNKQGFILGPFLIIR